MQLTFELLSFILSIVSLIVSGGAVWLSFKFYQMSDNASKEAKKSSDKIQVNTEKLEGLFSRLYSDTFTMMKDTVTDMREYIYHPLEKEKTLEDRLNEMKESINKEIQMTLNENFNGLQDNDIRINKIEERLESVINKNVNVVIEERHNDVENQILRVLSDGKKHIVFQMHELLSEKFKLKIDMAELITTLEKMVELELIASSSSGRINFLSIIKKI